MRNDETTARHSPVAAAAAGADTRMTWMDTLRGIAIIAVVMFHASTLLRYADLDAPTWVSDMNGALAPFRIPTLILLSGMLMTKSINKPTGEYVSGKMRNILWPYLLWSSVIGAILWVQYGVRSIKWLGPNVLYGGTYLWYLFFLLVFYLGALALRRVSLVPVVLAALALAELMPDETKYRERLLFLFALFLIGWIASSRAALLGRVLRSWKTVVIALGVVLLNYAFVDMSAYRPRAVTAVLAGACILAFAAIRLDRARVLSPVKFVGRNSIVFYTTHFPLIIAIMVLGAALHVGSASAMYVVAALAAVTFGTWLAWKRKDSAVISSLFSAPAWADRLVPAPVNRADRGVRA